MKFIGGPADGVHIQFQRIPIVLRVVRKQRLPDAATWDVLDQLGDVPEPDESIFVYRLRGTPQWVHLDGRDKNGKRWGRTEWNGDYVYLAEQPRDEEMRTATAWHEWASFNAERILAERAKEAACA